MLILFFTASGESQNGCAEDINLDQCTNSAGHDYVEILAADNNRFINEFVVVRHDNLTYMTHFMAGLLQHKLAHEDACNGPLPEEFMGVVCLLKASVYIFSIASMEDYADKSICATDILHFCNPFEQVQKKILNCIF